MARPPKQENQRKNVDLRIPVTSEQKDAITEAARILGVDMAAWARPILLREAQAIIGDGSRKS
jgi:uncharacterized protein (DUF1778 family)